MVTLRRTGGLAPSAVQGCASDTAIAPSIAAVAGLLIGLLCGLVHAQTPYQHWQFRPMEPQNARGAPPVLPAPYPTGERPAAGTSPAYGQESGPLQPPGSPTKKPRAQWPQGPYAPAQGPLGQSPGGFPQQPYGTAGPSQYPGMPYSGARVPGGQYPTTPYQSGQFGQFTQPSYPSYGTPAGVQGPDPYLEVTLADERPYVHENVLVRLRVISIGNLATASPDLTGLDEVLFEKVDGPKTSTRGSGSHREIVNEFVMAMTPLRDGDLEVGPLKVTGTLAGGVPFTAVARDPLRLQVRPAMAAVRPWLPLQTLQIKAEVDDTGEIGRGRPLPLTLELEAQGATGDQLPSLESMLRSDDFRIYREQTLTDTRLAPNGNTLIGKRIEYYTLVPQVGGRLQLPELRLGWWNVDTAAREASSVPIRTISVAGAGGPFGFSRTAARGDGSSWSVYWLPLAGVLLLLIGYWGGVWLRTRPTRAPLPYSQTRSGPDPQPGSLPATTPRLMRLRAVLQRAAGDAGRRLRASARMLDPSPLLQQGQRVLDRLTPKSTRVYRCAMAADASGDPATWCLAFQRHACRNLQASAREPLPRMADRIVDLRPGADRERVLQLMQQLDSALYNRQDIDFARWKRDFRRALRPGTGALRSIIAGQVRRAHLPALNPQPFSLLDQAVRHPRRG